MTTIIALDCETLGLELDAPIWEIAAVRMDADTGEVDPVGFHRFVRHDTREVINLPPSFAADYFGRYDNADARDPDEVGDELEQVFAPDADGLPPRVLGSNPSFDTERLIRQRIAPAPPELLWNHALIDIGPLMLGYLRGLGMLSVDLNWRSDVLSERVGVDPELFERHTALGDCWWAITVFRKIMGLDIPQSAV